MLAYKMAATASSLLVNYQYSGRLRTENWNIL